jgi:PAS domain S-box-containing protein
MSAEPASPLSDLPSLCLAITQHAPLPMVTLEGATHIVRYGNPAFCRMMGNSLEAIVGSPLDELLPDKDHCVTLIEHVFRTGTPASYTEREPAKPDPVFWSYTIWPVAEEQGLVGVMIQVTETAQVHGDTVAMNEALLLGSIRQHELTEVAEILNVQLRAEMDEHQHAAEELRASEERYCTLFNLGPVAVYSCDASGVIQTFNRRAAELWERKPAVGDTDERFCGSFKLFRPDGSFMPHEQCPMAEVIAGKLAVVRDAEVLIERPDGSRVCVVVNILPLKNERGEITGAINCFYNITERRLLEDTLAARVEELARADRSKDEFLAMLAHELRNPLAPLRNAAEILTTPGATPDEWAQAQGIMARQFANMTRLLDDLLDVSRFTRGKIELGKEPVALADILRSAAAIAQPGIARRGQEFALSLPAEPVFVDTDATRLEQVFGNLLNNASKYGYTGSHIALRAERDDTASPPAVIVRVSDDGMGISPELLPHIFDLFVQSTRSLDREHGGLGIVRAEKSREAGPRCLPLFGRTMHGSEASDEVRGVLFKTMEKDHEDVNKNLMTLADRMKMKMPNDIGDHQAYIDGLKSKAKANAPDFDRTYVAETVAAHSRCVAMFEKFSGETKNADLKAFADNTLPGLRTHLKRATDLLAVLGAAAVR